MNYYDKFDYETLAPLVRDLRAARSRYNRASTSYEAAVNQLQAANELCAEAKQRLDAALAELVNS